MILLNPQPSQRYRPFVGPLLSICCQITAVCVMVGAGLLTNWSNGVEWLLAPMAVGPLHWVFVLPILYWLESRGRSQEIKALVWVSIAGTVLSVAGWPLYLLNSQHSFPLIKN